MKKNGRPKVREFLYLEVEAVEQLETLAKTYNIGRSAVVSLCIAQRYYEEQKKGRLQKPSKSNGAAKDEEP